MLVDKVVGRAQQDLTTSFCYSFLFNFQLQATEEKVSKLEECDCTKSCQLPGGIIREDGASWSEGCQLCSCVVRPIICITL